LIRKTVKRNITNSIASSYRTKPKSYTVRDISMQNIIDQNDIESQNVKNTRNYITILFGESGFSADVTIRIKRNLIFLLMLAYDKK